MITALVATVLAAGCFGGSGNDTAAVEGSSAAAGRGDTLRVNMAQAPTTVDPATVCAAFDTGLVGALYSRLIRFETVPGPEPKTTRADTAKVKPWLAESWKVSDDGLTYTFTLRDGLKFPSGNPVDAKAVKYTFDRLIKMNQCGTAYVYDLQYDPPLIKSVDVVDPKTIQVRLNQPDTNALQAWAQPAVGIVDPSVVEAHGGVKANTVNKWMASHSAGYGPYELQSYEPNRQAVLVAYDGYFEPPPTKKVVINYVSADSTLALDARSGATDVTIGLSKQAIASLKDDSCCRVVATDTTSYEQVGFNASKAPFDNEKFREALAVAVPYDDIVDKVAYGYGRTYYGPWPPAFPVFNEDIEMPLEYDPDRAKELLAESGVDLPVTITLTLAEGNANERQIATILQDVWGQLGVKVDVRVVPAATFASALADNSLQAFLRYDGPSVVTPEFLWNYDSRCGVAFNYNKVCIKEADRLIDKMQRTTDPEKRQELADQVAELWVADHPRVQVYGDRFAAVLGPRVDKYHFTVDLFDPQHWSLEQPSS